MRASDPEGLRAWYRDCLGLDIDENGLWLQEAGPTVFATQEAETDYFGSRAQQTCSTSGCATWMRCSRNCAPEERTWPNPRRWRASADSAGSPIQKAPQLIRREATDPARTTGLRAPFPGCVSGPRQAQ